MNDRNSAVTEQLKLETARSLNLLGNCVRHLVKKEMPRALGPVPMLSFDRIDQSRVFDYLSESHEFVRRRLEKLANMMTDLEWFWYLRQMPEEVFEGSLPTTGPHDRLLAETAGVLWGKKSRAKRTLTKDGSLQVEVSKEKIRLLLEFVAHIKALATVQSNLRLCGKGAQFKLSSFRTLESDNSLAFDDSVALYDARIAVSAGSRLSFAGAGTQVGEHSLSALKKPDYFEVLSIAKSTRIAEYRPFLYDIEKIKQLNQIVDTSWWHPAAPYLIVLMKLCAIACGDMPEENESLTQNGYLLIDKAKIEKCCLKNNGTLEEFARTIFPNTQIDANLQTLLNEVDAIGGSVWPLKPAVTSFVIGRKLLIDLVSLRDKSKHVFEFPRVASKTGNARAGHFELVVQELINKSPWRPGDELLKLRGVPLQNEGRTITDLDALGCKYGRLLIVDCKSLIHDALYDQGHPSKVRSAIDAIEAKVQHWENIKQYFLNNQKGANYDFGTFDEIIALVCTPKPVYLPLGPATQEVEKGLLRCCALNELDSFLNQT